MKKKPQQAILQLSFDLELPVDKCPLRADRNASRDATIIQFPAKKATKTPFQQWIADGFSRSFVTVDG